MRKSVRIYGELSGRRDITGLETRDCDRIEALNEECSNLSFERLSLTNALFAMR
jgi:hypothetical protein